MTANIQTKLVKSSFWLYGCQILKQVLRIIRLIVIARILSPEDFGVFAVIFMLFMACESFMQTGFNQALIQKKHDVKSYLDTAWTVHVVKGVVLAIAIYFIAPYIHSFFHLTFSVRILQMVGLIVLFRECTNISVVYFEKELEFHKYFLYEIVGETADLIVSLIIAVILQNAWALVYGFATRFIVQCILSYFITRYTPRLSFDLQKAKELFHFGKWILGSATIVFLLTQGDHLLVGKLLGASALGFYQIAYKIAHIPAAEVSYVFTKVVFPIFSKLQDNKEKLRSTYLDVFFFNVMVIVPLSGLLVIFAKPITQIILGQKWMPIVPTLQVLGVYAGVKATSMIRLPILTSLGKPHILTKINFFKLVCLLVCIYPITQRFYFLGTAYALLGSELLCAPIGMFFVLRILNLPLRSILSRVAIAFSAFLPLLLVIKWSYITTFIDMNNLLTFGVFSIVLVLFYCVNIIVVSLILPINTFVRNFLMKIQYNKG